MRFICASFLVGLMITALSQSRAEEGIPLSSQAQRPANSGPSARDLYEQAEAQYQARHYESALQLFQRSYDLDQRLATLYGIGVCQIGLESHVEALATFQLYLARGGSQIPANRRSQVLQRIQALQALIGTLQIEVATEDGRDLPEEIEVDVFVDDELVPPDQLETLRVTAGPHNVRVEAEGYQQASRNIEARAQTVNEVSFELESLPEPEPPNRAWIWGVVGGVLAAAALGFGLGFGLQDDPFEGTNAMVDLP